MIDVSGSREFGTMSKLKKNQITEISAVLAFSAIQNNDKIGVIFFSDKIEKFIPPKKGKSHILRIIRELIDFKPEHRNTDITSALKYLTNAIKKRCTTFVISDFIDEGYENALTIANKKHDVVALKIYDKREEEIPSIGLIKVKDAETGAYSWIDTSNKKVRENYSKWWKKNNDRATEIFKRSGVDVANIRTDQDYVRSLISLFQRRGH
jgi:uncharacterized protein (DUF58 family)